MKREKIKKLLRSNSLDDKRLGMVGLAKLMENSKRKNSRLLKSWKTTYEGPSEGDSHMVIVTYKDFMLNTGFEYVYFSRKNAYHYKNMFKHDNLPSKLINLNDE